MNRQAIDAIDTISDARRMIDLIEIATRLDPTREAEAINAACYGVTDKLEYAIDLLKEHGKELRPLGAITGAALPASADTDTPVMRLFREWQRLESAAHAAEGDEYERLHDLRRENEKRMIREPSRSALDVLLKITAWTGFGEGDLEHDSPYIPIIWEEARALVA